MKPFHYFEQAGRRVLVATIALLAVVLFGAFTVSLALTPRFASWAWASASLAVAFALVAYLELRAARRNYRSYLTRK